MTIWVAVAAGRYHTVALQTDGTLWAWGNNRSGQLGDGTVADKSTLVQVGNSTAWAEVAAGYGHTVALQTDGTLWTWGENVYGQLGSGSTVSNINAPVRVGSAYAWTEVAAGDFHTVALQSDGTLWAWGDDGNGQLGDGTSANAPVQVDSDTASTWAVITTGNSRTVALQADGTLWAWGSNWRYQLGDGTKVSKKTPVQIGSGTA